MSSDYISFPLLHSFLPSFSSQNGLGCVCVCLPKKLQGALFTFPDISRSVGYFNSHWFICYCFLICSYLHTIYTQIWVNLNNQWLFKTMNSNMEDVHLYNVCFKTTSFLLFYSFTAHLEPPTYLHTFTAPCSFLHRFLFILFSVFNCMHPVLIFCYYSLTFLLGCF